MPPRSPASLLWALTSAQEEDVVGAIQGRHAVDGHALVVGLGLQQHAAADLSIHQEVVLEEVQHSIGELQRRVDLPLPGTIGDALKEKALA